MGILCYLNEVNISVEQGILDTFYDYDYNTNLQLQFSLRRDQFQHYSLLGSID